MLRGIGKQVVVLKNTDSKVFEQAIFILRDKKEIDKKDLLSECENIINSNLNVKHKNINKRQKTYIKIAIPILIISFTVFSILLLLNLM